MRPSAEHFTSSFSSFRSASSWFELYAAFSTFMMLLRTAINELIPIQIRSFIISKFRAYFFSHSSYKASVHITECWEMNRNELYYAAKEYLPTKIIHDFKVLKVGKLEKQNKFSTALDGGQIVEDVFDNIKLTWICSKIDPPSSHLKLKNSNTLAEKNMFVLTFDEKHREKVMESYLPYVLSAYEATKSGKKVLKIHTKFSDMGTIWQASKLNHPATFEKLAMEPELKKAIIDDLDRFLRRKEFYKKVGKAWKRGYMLYGPPGTGKSTLIAAIANYLKFDIYDLELSSVFSNSDLMSAVRNTSNRSILVIEDIDCNKEVLNRSKLNHDPSENAYLRKMARCPDEKFTLSGLLNYIDGLWSTCGEERFIIFTTNHIDKLDPALLRPGRMDMHIHLSFCKAHAFRFLASNYLDIHGHHPLFEEIESLLEEIEVSPATVAEELMRSEDPDVALGGLYNLLKRNKMESGDMEIKEEEKAPRSG
ncbi:AAA-ATPase [Quillaja saponaria]|uniref:AAA-ATPase n=1 Tax=Quillaja saponaria TaxID=32244 RepID=A0AAD7KR30_QUISA|nr:AAA-ATPase [Quillaja saponaria]KAJ7944241.1 AAA-ATPase [Quillaja saponaria]